MAAAGRAGLPPVAVGVATALAYGFGYTGHIARGFALAHLLLALLALAALEVWRRGARAERAAVAAATTGRRSADRSGADTVAPCSLPGAISWWLAEVFESGISAAGQPSVLAGGS